LITSQRFFSDKRGVEMDGSNRPSRKGWNRAAKKKRGGPKAGVHGSEGLKEDNECRSDVELALAASENAQDKATNQKEMYRLWQLTTADLVGSKMPIARGYRK
jgi:hypothetical protein